MSTVMTMPFHVKPFEKKVFEEVIFLIKYHQNSQVLKRRSIQKIERKSIKERKRKKKEKEEEKEKLQESLQIKGKSIFWEEKNTSTSKILFDMIPFSPLHHTISQTLSKIIEKVFLTLFGPSFSLAKYRTWVIPFLLTHELHIFSLWSVG
jgi:hypothetical protein